MTRRVDQLDLDIADSDDVAALVLDEGLVGDTGDLADILGLVGLNMDRHVDAVEQGGDALELEAHHGAAHVIGVVVRSEYARAAHAVGLDRVDQAVDVVGRIDQDGVTGLAIADRVDEVDHLAGDRVVLGEISPGQQLTEVEAIAHGVIVGPCPSTRGTDASDIAWRRKNARRPAW